MKRQSEIVRSFVKQTDWSRQYSSDYTESFVNSVLKLCDDFDKLSELSEKIDEAKSEISNAIRELKESRELNIIKPFARSPIFDSIKIATMGDVKQSRHMPTLMNLRDDLALLSEAEQSEFVKEAVENKSAIWTRRQRELLRKVRRIRLLAEDPEAKP